MLTRRNVIAEAPAALLVPVAPAIAEQHPLERLHELHKEVSHLMVHHNEAFGGRWELRVRAHTDRLPVIYSNLDAQRGEEPHANVHRL